MQALVSGGSSGIGLAIAKEVVSNGGTVVIGDINRGRGKSAVEQLGDGAYFVEWDITSEEQTARAFDRSEELLGPLSTVFANAGGVGVTGSLASTSYPRWQQTIELLLHGPFLTVRESLRRLPRNQDSAIVVTASVASLHGGLGPHAYTAAKSALRGLVESVAVETAPTGMRINAVAPGATVSGLSAALLGESADDVGAARERLAAASSSGTPTTSQDVARAAYFLASPGATRISGTTLVIDGADAVLPHSGRDFFRSEGSQR